MSDRPKFDLANILEQGVSTNASSNKRPSLLTSLFNVLIRMGVTILLSIGDATLLYRADLHAAGDTSDVVGTSQLQSDVAPPPTNPSYHKSAHLSPPPFVAATSTNLSFSNPSRSCSESPDSMRAFPSVTTDRPLYQYLNNDQGSDVLSETFDVDEKYCAVFIGRHTGVYDNPKFVRFLTEGVTGQSTRWFTSYEAAKAAYDYAMTTGRVHRLPYSPIMAASPPLHTWLEQGPA